MLSADERKQIVREVVTARSALLARFPLLGYLAMYADIEIVDDVDLVDTLKESKVNATIVGAGVEASGKQLTIGAWAWKHVFRHKRQRVALLAHEVLHLALKHPARMAAATNGHAQQTLYNLAADVIVNHTLMAAGFRHSIAGEAITAASLCQDDELMRAMSAEAPKVYQAVREAYVNGDDSRLRLLSVEELYAALLMSVQKLEAQHSAGSDGDSDGLADDPTEGLERALDEATPGHDLGGGRRDDDKDAGSAASDLDQALTDERRRIPVSKTAGGHSLEHVSDEAWDRAVQKALMAFKGQGRGDTTGALEIALEPDRNQYYPWWAQVIASLVAVKMSRYSYDRINRRHVWRGVHMPSMVPQKPELLLYVDTSGSTVGSGALRAFCTSLYDLVQSANVTLRLMAGDTDVLLDRVVESADDIPDEWPGGGGTDFTPLFQRIASEGNPPDYLVMMTDCMGLYPANPPGFPMLTVVPPGEPSRPPYGRVAILEPMRGQ